MMRLLMDLLGAMLVLSGASAAEDLEESEIERFQHYAAHPLRINQVPRSKMLSSGLLSAYQVAALEEYRSMSGDILGPGELALVDGIGPLVAEALVCFVSFESRLPPGARRDRRVRQTIMVRGGVRSRGADTASFAGAKYHVGAGERWEFFWSSRNSYSAGDFTPGTFSAAIYGNRGWKLVAGDFSARFGQGLALWSGFSPSGFSSVSAFKRNASGLAPTGSFSPAFRGLAGDFSAGRWTFSAALALPGLRERMDGDTAAVAVAMPVLAASRLGRRSSIGALVYYCGGPVVSADWTVGISHFTLFGEVAASSRRLVLDGTAILRTRAAALCALVWSPAYMLKFSALARYYPSGYDDTFSGAVRSASRMAGESGFSLGGKWRTVEFTADAARYPDKGTWSFKGLAVYSPVFRAGEFEINPVLRLTERRRTADSPLWRHELRSDLKLSVRGAQLNCRFDAVRMKSDALAAYAEAGYKTPADTARVRLSAFVRATVFRVDNWDDRIYFYERDIPGSFSVPALYGRGRSFSAFFGVKTSRHSLYVKASLLRYPAGERPSAAEVRLQYQLEL